MKDIILFMYGLVMALTLFHFQIKQPKALVRYERVHVYNIIMIIASVFTQHTYMSCNSASIHVSMFSGLTQHYSY